MKSQILDSIVWGRESNVQLDLFLISLALSAFCGLLLGLLYEKFGRTVSDRKAMTTSAVYLALLTTFIITIVQSSITLSLGLIGSLSIVRFRTPVKEPEELLIFFAAIAIGLGFGAQLYSVTACGFAAFIVAMIVFNKKKVLYQTKRISLSLIAPTGSLEIKKILEIIKPACSQMELVRVDENKSQLQITLHLMPTDFEGLDRVREELRRSEPEIQWSLVDFRPLT